MEYLAGPSICGLHGAFEADYGDPNTAKPYARITPSRVGAALLPFHCPSCDEPIDFSDNTKRECYHDTREMGDGSKRDNYWCPSCAVRFLLNLKGKRFDGKIVDSVAPSSVETISVGIDGMVNYVRKNNRMNLLDRLSKHYVRGTDILSAP